VFRPPQLASQTDGGGEPDPPRVDEADRGVLDYGWWASNGLTGGCLTSLALDITCRTTRITPSWARSATLHLVRLAAADRYHATVTVVTGGTRIAVANVLFTQEEPFATASVHFSPPRGANTAADATPPAVLSPEAYADMATDLRALQIMGQFSYWPTAAADGRNAHNGWDRVGPGPHGRRQLDGSAQYACSTPGIQRTTCDSSANSWPARHSCPTHQPSTSSPHQCCSQPAKARTGPTGPRSSPAASIPPPTAPPRASRSLVRNPAVTLAATSCAATSAANTNDGYSRGHSEQNAPTTTPVAKSLETIQRVPSRRLRRVAHRAPRSSEVGALPEDALATDEVPRARFLEAMQRRRVGLGALIEDAVDAGDLVDVPTKALAAVFLALGDGLMFHRVLDPPGSDGPMSAERSTRCSKTCALNRTTERWHRRSGKGRHRLVAERDTSVIWTRLASHRDNAFAWGRRTRA